MGKNRPQAGKNMLKVHKKRVRKFSTPKISQSAWQYTYFTLYLIHTAPLSKAFTPSSLRVNTSLSSGSPPHLSMPSTRHGATTTSVQRIIYKILVHNRPCCIFVVQRIVRFFSFGNRQKIVMGNKACFVCF